MILVVFRIGAHIPIPGIDSQALASFFNANSKGLLGHLDMFSGGALRNMTIFALGIMPYISASIIIQLGGAIIPYFQKLQREGEEGRKRGVETADEAKEKRAEQAEDAEEKAEAAKAAGLEKAEEAKAKAEEAKVKAEEAKAAGLAKAEEGKARRR